MNVIPDLLPQKCIYQWTSLTFENDFCNLLVHLSLPFCNIQTIVGPPSKNVSLTWNLFESNCFVSPPPPPQVNDTLDDIFDGSDDEEESQDIVNQVLDEIGIEISGKVGASPILIWK